MMGRIFRVATFGACAAFAAAVFTPSAGATQEQRNHHAANGQPTGQPKARSTARSKGQSKRQPNPQPPRQIACTVLGCMPVPAVCHPKEEHTSGGIPTGYDQIVCPPGVWPF